MNVYYVMFWLITIVELYEWVNLNFNLFFMLVLKIYVVLHICNLLHERMKKGQVENVLSTYYYNSVILNI